MWNSDTIHPEKSMLLFLMTLMQRNLFFQSHLLSEKSDKRYYGSSNNEQNYCWLYFSQIQRGLMFKIYEKYLYSGG